MKLKYLLLAMILFSCLFLFSIPSLALIPGDFGSAGGGPPDGVVDFEDLMIFALAYGSTSADANWNPACDIAGPDGSTAPDGVIDFEDLMIFAMHYGEEAQAIIPDTTEIIGEETEQAILSVSEDQSTMVLSHSTPQTDSIEVGDIIVMGITDQTPYGLLRRVTSINRGLTKESQVILDTEFATLEEAIQKGQWEYDHTLKPEDIEKGFVFPEGIQPVRGKASTTLDFEYDINVILYDKDDNPDTTEDNIMATGYLAFNYQIIFDGDIDGFTLKHFIFENIIQTDSKLDISVGGSVSIDDLADVGDVTIGKPIPFTPVTVLIPTPIGIPIPLVFFPSIELKAGIEGEAHIVLETGIRQIATYTAGIEFTEGNWQNITTSPQVDYYDYPIEVYGGIHVIAHAGPQLNCKLYKVAGPYCNIFGYLDFEADTTLDPWWDLDAMLKVLAGVKLDILTIHWESGELELINLSRDIIDAGGPFGGTGPVHNLTKGTYYNTIQAALNDADNNNTIEVADGTYDESINFPLGKMIILQSVNGPSSTIIQGDDGLSTVTLNNSPEGTTLEGFTITHESGNSGRGIFISDNGHLSINNCTISGNHSAYRGGGICASCPVMINNSTISNNHAEKGGGIYIYGYECCIDVTINRSTILNNSADFSGGGINNERSILTISDSTISGNHGAYWGGGICNGSHTLTTITRSIISDNTSHCGGGICNTRGATLTISNSSISDNTAYDHGGGIDNRRESWYSSTLTISNSSISGNTAYIYGGGINNYNSTLTITESAITSNISNDLGGGIMNVQSFSDALAVTITGSAISGNTVSHSGGGIYNSGKLIMEIGGNSSSDKNIICGNYKSGYCPSLDQQICDNNGSLYETYKNTNYIYADCPVIPNETVYRAFLVGVGDYVEDTYDLPEPPYDVDRMDYILSQCSFSASNTQFSIILPLKDLSATKSAILQGIASVFSGSDDNDISYFYFSGHGYLDSGTNISYLCPTDTTLVLDLSTMISIDELETALSAIAGTKVVFIGACHSGGFIGKGEEEVIISKEELGSFNQEIINVFSQASSKGLLTTNQYQVLTSCRSDQISGGWEDPSVVEGPFGVFDMALCEGGGYFGNYPADTNSDNKVSLNEAYLYIIDWVNDFFEGLPPLDVDLQDVQVYPNDSTFAIIEY